MSRATVRNHYQVFRSLSVVLLLLAVSVPLCGVGPDKSPPLKVTYVANCGFLVECGAHKILIDALLASGESQWYDLPSDSVVALMTAARAPFDNVDLIAVTHAHFDHFDPEVASRLMKQDTDVILVCPSQAEDQMRASPFYEEIKARIRAVAASADSVESFEVSGIRVSALSGQHSPYFETDSLTGETVNRHRNVQHQEYLFSVGGRTVYHGGDALMNDFERYTKLGLGQDSIDLAFVHAWHGGERLSFEQKLVHDVIRPGRVFLMHLIPGREPPGDPEQQAGIAREIILPRKSLQTWSFE